MKRAVDGQAGNPGKWHFASVFLLFTSGCVLFGASASTQTKKYDVTAARVSLTDLNSTEQRLVQIYTTNSAYHFRLAVVVTNYHLPNYNPLKRSYSRELLPFLAGTVKIVTNDLNLAVLSQRLWPPDGDVAVYLTNSLRWVATNIAYDSDLATKIGNGESDTRSSADVLTLRKGTCSEYSNLFIALMRYRNIPAAYVAGYYSGGGYHAWAEVYLDGAGWVSVEPQGGTVGISTGHIKLFRDVDFPTIHVKLGEIKIKTSVISD